MSNEAIAATAVFFVFALIVVAGVAFSAGRRSGFEEGARQRDEIVFRMPFEVDRADVVVQGGTERADRYFDVYVRQLVFVMGAIRHTVDPRTRLIGGMTVELWDSWVEPDVLTPVRTLLGRRHAA